MSNDPQDPSNWPQQPPQKQTQSQLALQLKRSIVAKEASQKARKQRHARRRQRIEEAQQRPEMVWEFVNPQPVQPLFDERPQRPPSKLTPPASPKQDEQERKLFMPDRSQNIFQDQSRRMQDIYDEEWQGQISFHTRKKQATARQQGYKLDITRVGIVQLLSIVQIDNKMDVSENLQNLAQLSGYFTPAADNRIQRYFNDSLQDVQITRQALKQIWRTQKQVADMGFITDTFVKEATVFLREFSPMQTAIFLPLVDQRTLVTQSTLSQLKTSLEWPQDPRRGITRAFIARNIIYQGQSNKVIVFKAKQGRTAKVQLSNNQFDTIKLILQKVRQSEDQDALYFNDYDDLAMFLSNRNMLNNQESRGPQRVFEQRELATGLSQIIGQIITQRILSTLQNKDYIARRILAMRLDSTRRCIGWNSLKGLFSVNFGPQDLDFVQADGGQRVNDFRTTGTMMDLSPQTVQFVDQKQLTSLFRRRTMRLAVAYIIRQIYSNTQDLDVFQIQDRYNNNQIGILSPITVYWLSQLFCEVLDSITRVLEPTDMFDLMVIRTISKVVGVPAGYLCLRQGINSSRLTGETIQLGHITVSMLDGQSEQRYIYQMIGSFIRTLLKTIVPYLNSITQRFFRIPKAINNGVFSASLCQGVFIISQQPSNIGNMNRNKSNNNAMIPIITRSTAVNAFKGWVQRQTSKLRSPLTLAVGQVDRRLRFSTHFFKSQTSSIKILTLFLNDRIQSQISQVLQIRGLQPKDIQSFVIYVSIQFVQYNYEGPATGFQAAYRTGSFKIVLSDIQQAGQAMMQQGYNYYPQSISVLDNKTGYSSVQVRMRAKQFQKAQMLRSMRGMKGQEFLKSELIQQVTRMVTQNTLMQIANYAFTASGPLFDQDYDAQQNFTPQDLEATVSIQGVTVFSMPLFTRSTVPLAVADPRLRPPTNNQSTSSHKHILRQNKVRDKTVRDGFYNTHYQYGGHYGGYFDQMPCLTSVAIQTVMWHVCDEGWDHNANGSPLVHIKNTMLKVMNQQVFTISQTDRDGTQLQSLTLWCLLIRKMLNIYRIKVPIFIFILEGVQLLQYDTASSQSQAVLTALRDTNVPKQMPVIAVQCCYSQQAHAFPTTIQYVRQFISAAAAGPLRNMKYNTKNHTGFQLYKKNPKKPGLPWRIVQRTPREEILDDVMDNVWTLDIQTLSAPGVQMTPYCICIYSQLSQLTYFGTECRKQFRQFLKNLSDTRKSTSEPLTILAHNGAKFDWVILFRDILDTFPNLQLFGTTTDIKMIAIPQINIRFCDFFLLMSDSLQKIADNFNSPVKQIKNQDIQNLRDVNDLTQIQADNIKRYCMNDTICLWQCVKLFAQEVIQIADLQTLSKIDFVIPPTSSQLAVNIFSHNFLKESLRGTIQQIVDDIQTKAYFGGVTQVFNFATQHQVKYVDVNSLYPSAMRNIQVQSNPAQLSDINRNFRFAYTQGRIQGQLKEYNIYKVQMFQWRDDVIGMFPVRTKQGGLCYPQQHFTQTGQDEYWLTGVQIIAAVQSEMLNQIFITAALQYQTVSESVFQQYINTIYQRRRNATGVQQQLYKLLLNQLYGQFAQRKFDTRILVQAEHIANDPQLPTRLLTQNLNAAMLHDIMTGNGQVNNILSMYQNRSMQQNMIPQLTAVNRIDSRMQWLQLVIQQNVTDLQSIGYLKRVSLMTTGHARAIMTRAIGAIYRKIPNSITKHIYYMDTDSFFMSQTAYQIMQSMALIDQSQLGKFKDQFPDTVITEAKFFAAKIYYLVDDRGKFMTKFKGVQKSVFEKLSISQKRKLFQNLLDPQQVHKVQMQRWQRNFSQIVISDILKTTIAKPRRLANPDGTSQQFLSVRSFQEHNKQQRLTFNRQTEQFEFTQIN